MHFWSGVRLRYNIYGIPKVDTMKFLRLRQDSVITRFTEPRTLKHVKTKSLARDRNILLDGISSQQYVYMNDILFGRTIYFFRERQVMFTQVALC